MNFVVILLFSSLVGSSFTATSACEPLDGQITGVINLLQELLIAKEMSILEFADSVMKFSPNAITQLAQIEYNSLRKFAADAIATYVPDITSDYIFQVIIGVDTDPIEPLACEVEKLLSIDALIKNELNAVIDVINSNEKIELNLSTLPCSEAIAKFTDDYGVEFKKQVQKKIQFFTYQMVLLNDFAAQNLALTLETLEQLAIPYITGLADITHVSPEVIGAFLSGTLSEVPDVLICLQGEIFKQIDENIIASNKIIEFATKLANNCRK